MKNKNIFWLIVAVVVVLLVVLLIGGWAVTSWMSDVMAANANVLLAQEAPSTDEMSVSSVRRWDCSVYRDQVSCEDGVADGGLACQWTPRISERFVCQVDPINPCSDSPKEECAGFCGWTDKGGGKCFARYRLPNCAAKSFSDCYKMNEINLKGTGGRYGCQGSFQIIDNGSCRAVCYFGQTSCRKLNQSECNDAVEACIWQISAKGSSCQPRINCSLATTRGVARCNQLGGGGVCQWDEKPKGVSGSGCVQADGRQCMAPRCLAGECRQIPPGECVPVGGYIRDNNNDGICDTRYKWSTESSNDDLMKTLMDVQQQLDSTTNAAQKALRFSQDAYVGLQQACDPKNQGVFPPSGCTCPSE